MVDGQKLFCILAENILRYRCGVYLKKDLFLVEICLIGKLYYGQYDSTALLSSSGRMI